MSTDRKIKGHAGSYGVAKYGLLVFRIPGAAGGPANWFGWLGVPCHRVCIGVAVFAQMTAGVIGADV